MANKIVTYAYRPTGFVLVTGGDFPLRWYECDTDTILKGDALHSDGTGYATNAITAFASTFMGIAAFAVTNAGSKGDYTIGVIPPYLGYQWIVPVAANAQITQAAVGTIIDLEAVNTVDVSDTTGAGNAPGFYVDAIDVSTAALAAKTYGYAIGHFVPNHA